MFNNNNEFRLSNYVSFDIETRTNYNKENIKDSKVDTYICQFESNGKYFKTNTIKEFINIISKKRWSNKKVVLIAHNGSKYDFWFLFNTLKKELGFKVYNKKANNLMPLSDSITDKELKNNEVIVSVVRSRKSISLTFKINNIVFETKDTYNLFMLSLKDVGNVLYRNNLILKDYLKTDYNYVKYNDTPNLSVKEIYDNLSDDELLYCRNDVAILYYARKYYNDITNVNFKFNNNYLTQNVLNYYIKKDAYNKYQLMLKASDKKVNYSEYKIDDNTKLFEVLSASYRGGICAYNYKYLNKVLKDVSSYDVNSEYPSVMYNFKLPIHLTRVITKKTTINVNDVVDNYNNNNKYSIFKISLVEFNNILKQIKSKVFRSIILKYYKTAYNNYICLNTATCMIFKILNIKKFKADLILDFDCEYFAGRNLIEEQYRIKTIMKSKYELDMADIRDIKVLEKESSHTFNDNEYATSKILLNSIYGAPAISPTYDIYEFSRELDTFKLCKDGLSNNERNIMFSSSITAFSFYWLFKEILTIDYKLFDKEFYYTDTDSLKLGPNLAKEFEKIARINSYNIGDFDKENTYDTFKMFNHKSYLYTYKDKYTVKIAGISKESVNKILSTITSVEQFYDVFKIGKELSNLKSQFNNDNDILLYESITVLDIGKEYDESIDIPLFYQSLLKIKSLAYDKGDKVENESGIFYELDGITFSPNELAKIRFIDNLTDLKPIDELIKTVEEIRWQSVHTISVLD